MLSEKFEKCNLGKSKLIEEIDVKDNDIDEKHKSGNFITDVFLKNILKDLNDPLIPVQGHGLIELARLLEKKHHSLIGQEDYIFDVSLLIDEDHFVHMFKMILTKYEFSISSFFIVNF